MYRSIFSRGLKPVLSRLPEINSIFQLNKSRLWEKGLRRRDNQFYIGSPQRATSSLLCTPCKESSTNSINCSHTINQPIPTPRRNQNPTKLINCSPQPPINFSRNTQLTQFLLPVEIKNPAKLINCSPQLPINFSRNPG